MFQQQVLDSRQIIGDYFLQMIAECSAGRKIIVISELRKKY